MALPHPPARKRKMPERKKLNVGQFIASEKDAYKIESILGSGGFGDVYKVVCTKDDKRKYAMKTEYFDPRKRKLLNRLKAVFLKSETELEVEMGVFTEIQKAPPDRKKHFIQMVDKGQTELFKFIVMEIVSHSLEDIRKYMLSGKLTWQTAIKVASQTLIAISDLHSIGYIHRDIKPHNFAIGRAPMQTQIYMLDFGIARRYIEKDGRVRVPRVRVTFLGTVKFASRMCHSEQEQCRKDDLEVWIYMILELFEQENLIWRRQTDRGQILQLKEKLFNSTDELELRMPVGFKKVMEYVNKLNVADDPDYKLLDNILMACAKTEKLDMGQPFDWIDKVMPEKTKPKKKAPAARLENDDDSADRRRRQRREEKAKKDAAAKKDKPSSDVKKEDEEEDEEDDEEGNESKDKDKGSNGRLSGEGGGKVRKSNSRVGGGAGKKKASKETSREANRETVDVDPGKKASGEKFDKDGDKNSKEKRAEAGAASKMQKLSKRTNTSDTPGSNKKSDTDIKRGSDKHRKSARKLKSNRRSVKKKLTSDKDKQPSVAQKPAPAPPVVIGPAPTGPPPKNVSVMITPTGQDEKDFVRSGYISMDMGPAGRK